MAYSHDTNDVTTGLTSNTSPSPNVASASSVYTTGYEAYRAFDHENTGAPNYNCWASLSESPPWWLKFYFGSGNGKSVNRYKLTSRASAAGFQSPKAWKLQGSNNDSDWTDLDTRSGETSWSDDETREYSFSNSTTYEYIRLYITEGHSTICAVGELELFATTVTDIEITAVPFSAAATASASIKHEVSNDAVPFSATSSLEGQIHARITAVPFSAESTMSALLPIPADVTASPFEATLTAEADMSIVLTIESVPFIAVSSCHGTTGVTLIISDALAYTEQLQVGYTRTASTSIGFLETLRVTVGAKIAELLSLIEGTPNIGKFQHVQRESILVAEALSLLRGYLNIISESLVVSESITKGFAKAISEVIRLVGSSVLGNIRTYDDIADGFSVTENVFRGFRALISDQMSLSTAAVWSWQSMLLCRESLAFSEDLTETNHIIVQLADAYSLSDVSQSAKESHPKIADSFLFNMRIILNGEVYQCWVVTTDQFYPSIYTGFDFSSYAVLDNVLYGTREDGIYKIDSTTDSGSVINAGYILDADNLGTQLKKRIYSAYFGVVGTTPAVKIVSDNSTVTYYLVEGRAKVSVGQEGCRWVFKLVNITELDFIEITPVTLTRT